MTLYTQRFFSISTRQDSRAEHTGHTVHKRCGVMRALLLLLIYFTLTVSITGCTLRPADVSQSQDPQLIEQQKLNKLKNWSVRGKLAFISERERKSAYINWQQSGNASVMNLTSVVGTNIASLDYDGKLASLRADGQLWQDQSPSALIYRTTGWDVPVEFLSDWMKGAVASSLVTERFENGLVKRVVTKCDACLPWTINYTRYGEFTLDGDIYTLPISMRLTQNQAQIQTSLVLRIDNWTHIDAPND
ncbi:lipoprotein insertase outer membrane protein LolB [Glaciecola siphonariae]|uniref:Outer-membrane lipoprotein LolB n=1 Tax=Glaciecola siphonariae TaxID=521012 RepID=A0ABV9LT54_9ALTE